MRLFTGIWKSEFGIWHSRPRRCGRPKRLRYLLAAALLSSTCGGPPPPQPKDVVVWKPVGTWSGRGNSSTNTFTSDAGGFRVHWQTTNAARPDAGRLRVVFHSADSGREIIEAMDAKGTGSGVEEVSAERPRWYYLTIESVDVDWTVTVDERIDAQTVTP
jgi:hypothetical protein